jgi:hypothetical protein
MGIVPKYFSMTAWDTRILAICNVRRFSVEEVLPGDFADLLPFHVADGGSSWPDVVRTSVGVLLFAERVMSCFKDDAITGIDFYEAPISGVDSARLKKKQRPNYFWGRASGLMDFDMAAYRRSGQFVPVEIRGAEKFDIFHFNYPTGPCGYGINRRVVETLRKHKIGNVNVQPLDYYQVDKRDFFTPPFRIDVLAKKWPPDRWYPEGFMPHPYNVAE